MKSGFLQKRVKHTFYVKFDKMKTKILKITVLILALAVINAGCKDKEHIGEQNDLCSYIHAGNIDQTIPIIDEYLSKQPNDLDDSEKLQELTAWLKSQSCITDASVLCQSCIETNTPTSSILISNDENEKFVLDISMCKPWKAIGYHEYDELKVKFCSYINKGDIDQVISIINEYLEGLPYEQDADKYYEGVEQNLQEFVMWLKSCSCIVDASVFNLYCACGRVLDRPHSKIAFSFGEKENAKEIFLDVSWRFGDPFMVHNYHDDPILAFFEMYFPLISLYGKSECFFVDEDLKYGENKFLMVNSMDEFLENFSCSSTILPAIDYNLNTLIIGMHMVGGTGVRIVESNIVIGPEIVELTLIVEHPDGIIYGSYPTVCPLYFWGVYTKIQNKSINVNVIYLK